MNLSYDYSELLAELRGDVHEGLIGVMEEIRIVRAEKPVYLNYRPIIDYYYLDDACPEAFEVITVAEALKEMTYQSKIIK